MQFSLETHMLIHIKRLEGGKEMEETVTARGDIYKDLQIIETLN